MEVQMAETADYEGVWRPAKPVVAPHGGRLIAFGADLVIILLVGLAVGGGWLRILAVFIAYHTVLVWLTGQTVGKAIANLEVRRIDGDAYQRTPRGLPWALGRAGVGYLLVDMLGLGVLVAVPRRNVTRRCLHDLVFGSQVVLRGEVEWALPKVRKRLSDFAHRREDAVRRLEEAQAEPRRLSNLWQWMVTGALGLEKVLDFVQHTVTQVSSWFGGVGQAHAGTTTLSTKAATGVAVGSGAVTLGTIATIALVGPAADASVVGIWERAGSDYVVAVEQTGPTSFVGRNSNDNRTRTTGCVFEAGEVKWRFRGTWPEFRGKNLWVEGRNGENCEFYWSPGTYLLDDGGTDDPDDDSLRACTTSSRSGAAVCTDFSRR